MNKNEMIELVKNAPDGAVEHSPSDDEYYEAYYNEKDEFYMPGFPDRGWNSVGATMDKCRRVKLDYSVLGDKPVYTKAMMEAGELPPVGCECVIAESTEYMKVGYKSGTVVKIYARFVDDRGAHLAAFVDANGQVGGVGVWQCFKPVKTDQEKLIDEICDCLSRSKIKAGYEGYAINLLEDFNITKKA